MTHGQSLAVVIGDGGIGRALADRLEQDGGCARVMRLSRRDGLDVTSEDAVRQAAGAVAAAGMELRLVLVATGILQAEGISPEKALRDIDAAAMAHAFAVNTIGPALLMKHVLPLLPRTGRSVFAALSARVGSIGDNRLGGWHSYRASKAALNQLVRTVSIELRRRCPEAICVALHPGTVATPLSAPFAREGLEVQTPELAAARLLAVVAGLRAEQSGGFFDQLGREVPW